MGYIRYLDKGSLLGLSPKALKLEQTSAHSRITNQPSPIPAAFSLPNDPQDGDQHPVMSPSLIKSEAAVALGKLPLCLFLLTMTAARTRIMASKSRAPVQVRCNRHGSAAAVPL